MAGIERDNHIIYGLEKELEKLKVEILKLKTGKGKHNKIQNFYNLLERYKGQLENKELSSELEINLSQILNERENSKLNENVVDGLIKHYSLEEWWVSVFTKEEQKYIEERFQPMGGSENSLTHGEIDFTSQTKADFLSSLISWFKSKEDSTIRDKIRKKLVEVGIKEPILEPGYFKGRHFSSFTEDVEMLLRENNNSEAESLLCEIVNATKSESINEGHGVAPWAYEKLAILYHKQKDLEKEIDILERFAKQKHARGVKPPLLLERLEKAKHKLGK